MFLSEKVEAVDGAKFDASDVGLPNWEVILCGLRTPTPQLLSTTTPAQDNHLRLKFLCTPSTGSGESVSLLGPLFLTDQYSDATPVHRQRKGNRRAVSLAEESELHGFFRAVGPSKCFPRPLRSFISNRIADQGCCNKARFTPTGSI